MESLKDRTDQVRRERGLSINELARRMNDMDKANLRAFLRREDGSQSRRMMKLLAAALEIDLPRLITGVKGLGDWVGDWVAGEAESSRESKLRLGPREFAQIEADRRTVIKMVRRDFPDVQEGTPEFERRVGDSYERLYREREAGSEEPPRPAPNGD